MPREMLRASEAARALGISLDTLAVALAAEGFDENMVDTLAALADLDLDGDGEPDALSAAFRFDATACELVP